MTDNAYQDEYEEDFPDDEEYYDEEDEDEVVEAVDRKSDDPTAEVLAILDKTMEKVRDLMANKSKAYGDAWRRQGYMGNLARILSKAARLENLLWRDRRGQAEVLEESVEDTVLDLIALCVFFRENWLTGIPWGRSKDRV